MIYLADNDIVLKLAQCDLLSNLPDILGSPCENVFVSPTAIYQLLPRKKDKALSKCGNSETLERLTCFLNTVETISTVNDISLLNKLESIDGIDAGENWLFVSAIEIDNSLLMTGDKRALKTLLFNREQIPQVFSALENNVVTFESIILLAIHKLGFAIVKQKLLGSPKPDGMLKIALRNDGADLQECLLSFIVEIKPLLAFKELFLSEKLEK